MFVVAIIIVGIATALSSFWIMRHVADRPANGEIKTLKQMHEKLEALRIESVDM